MMLHKAAGGRGAMTLSHEDLMSKEAKRREEKRRGAKSIETGIL